VTACTRRFIVEEPSSEAEHSHEQVTTPSCRCVERDYACAGPTWSRHQTGRSAARARAHFSRTPRPCKRRNILVTRSAVSNTSTVSTRESPEGRPASRCVRAIPGAGIPGALRARCRPARLNRTSADTEVAVAHATPQAPVPPSPTPAQQETTSPGGRSASLCAVTTFHVCGYGGRITAIRLGWALWVVAGQREAGRKRTQDTKGCPRRPTSAD